MDIELENLRAKPGELIAPKWEQLLRYLRRLTQLRRGNGVRIKAGPDGTSVVSDARAVRFVPHFAVRIGRADEVHVRLGLVNGQVPTLDGVRIDGLTEDGQPSPKPVPALSIKEGADDSLRSWVCIVVQIDPATGEWIEKEPLKIEHRADVPARLRNGYSMDEKGTGIYPLALLVWRDRKTLGRIHQVTMHDLQHAYRPAKAPLPARHYFWPA